MKNLKLGFGSQLLLLLTLLSTGLSAQAAVIVYSNNFDNGAESLSDFTVGSGLGDIGPYSVSIESGQLKISTSTPTPSKGYAAINTSNFAPPYNSILKNNPGLVSWSFNLSNCDGIYNNEFFFTLASNACDSTLYTSTSYIFSGGGYVGNRMMLSSNPLTPIIDIQNGGLPTLPSKGSFRITYNPTTDVWSLYGQYGSSYVDPTSITYLLGSGTDSTYTHLSLPYMCIGGGDTGVDYFDNVTISVIPEPTTLLLLGLGAVLLSKRR